MRSIARNSVASIAALLLCGGMPPWPAHAQDNEAIREVPLDALNAWLSDMADAASLKPGGVVVSASQAATLHACAAGLARIVGDESAGNYIFTTGGHFEQDTAWALLSQYMLLQNNPGFSHSDLREYTGPGALFCFVSETGPRYALPRSEGRLEWLDGGD